MKFLSRLLTALNLLPSIATMASENSFRSRHSRTNSPAHAADRRAIVLAEVRDRLEVRRQAAGEPHQLDIALGLALQAPARLTRFR